MRTTCDAKYNPWNFTWKLFFCESRITFLSVTQIFREINFRNFRGPTTSILRYLEVLEFDFYEFLYFLKAENCQNKTFRASKIAKTAVFELLDWPKLISRKISLTEKSWIFNNVPSKNFTIHKKILHIFLKEIFQK